MSQEDVILRFLQITFTLLFITAVIVDRERIADNIASFKNKIYRLKHKKEIAFKEQNLKNLYSYIFYVILPELTKDQFIKVCSHNFKYNDNDYELYLEKERDDEDFFYTISLKKIVSIRRYTSILQNILIDTNKDLIFFFRFKRTGPKNIYINSKRMYKDNLNIVLTALMLIHIDHRANDINNCPNFKGDKEIYEQLD